MHDIDLTDINVMKSPYFYLQPNDLFKTRKTWGTGKTESIGTLVSLLSLANYLFFYYLKIKNPHNVRYKDFQFLKTKLVSTLKVS
jgi:hypothetical protein